MKMRKPWLRAKIAVDANGQRLPGTMFDRVATDWFAGSLRRGMRMVGTACVASVAAGQATDAHTADIELGRYLSSECMTCHGTAKADSTIPNIIGLGQTHFVEVIRAYRAKALPNPVMQTIASRLKDEEIAALALYFATAKKPK